MKFGIAILVTLVVCLSPSVHGGESDVVRIFDDKLRLTGEQMSRFLKQADLEKYGFEKTVEVSTETDKNGKTTTKRTIYYKVTDDCSRVGYWDGVLEQRLPKKLKGSNIFLNTQKEVQSRIAGRKTKSCTVALEIHPNNCWMTSRDNGVSKRSGPKLCICIVCFKATIVYDD